MTRKLLQCTLGIALVSATLLPAVTAAHAAESVTLRYRFTKGDNIPYTMVMKITPLGTASLATGTVEMRVAFRLQTVSVLPDGSADIQAKYGDATVTSNGRTITTALGKMLMTYRISPSGSISNSKVEGSGAPAGFDGSGLRTNSVFLPNMPVHIGSTWTGKQDLNLGTMGAASGLMTYTLKSFDTWKGTPAVTIRTTGKVPFHFSSNGMRMEGTGDITGDTTLATGTGTLLKAHGNISINMTSSGASESSGVPKNMSLAETIDVVQG